MHDAKLLLWNAAQASTPRSARSHHSSPDRRDSSRGTDAGGGLAGGLNSLTRGISGDIGARLREVTGQLSNTKVSQA